MMPGLSPADHETRRRRIGSTDISTILAFYRPELSHLAKYRNATDTWLRLVHGIEQPRNSSMGRGIRLEPALRELYRSSVGPVDEPPGTLIHSAHDWACASPDGLTAGAVVEFKSASEWIRNQWGEPGTDKVPDGYNLQVQWIMEVAGRAVTHVLCAFGRDYKNEDGNADFAVTETAVYIVKRDPILAATMLGLGQRFFLEHVIPRVPPLGLVPEKNRREFKRLEKLRNETNANADRGCADEPREWSHAAGSIPVSAATDDGDADDITERDL